MKLMNEVRVNRQGEIVILSPKKLQFREDGGGYPASFRPVSLWHKEIYRTDSEDRPTKGGYSWDVFGNQWWSGKDAEMLSRIVLLKTGLDVRSDHAIDQQAWNGNPDSLYIYRQWDRLYNNFNWKQIMNGVHSTVKRWSEMGEMKNEF